MQPKFRLRELDFLRGIAIILVLFRHQFLFTFLKNMGWIGVDLFFVLSGFLVSGLLFQEYQKFGNINPKLFLIRRGFKIYPIFYLTYIVYLIPIIIKHKLEIEKMFYDLFFIQNYALGWGYTYAASWSLAVEEHFYFGLVLLLWLLFNKNYFKVDLKQSEGILKFQKILIYTLLSVLIIRIISNFVFQEMEIKNITMTHLRIDSLLFGVLISFWYYFKRDALQKVFNQNKRFVFPLVIILLSFTPFVEYIHSVFVKTIGFTLVYLAFGVLLIYFLLDTQINTKLNQIFTPKAVDFISKIGFCSYSIYVIHSLVIYFVNHLHIKNHYLTFLIVFVLSVFSGFIMTYKIERYFLNYRNKHYPNRI